MATLSSILGTGSFAPTSSALTATATVDIDLTSDTFFTLTPDQNTTFTVSNVPAVSQFNLALTGFATTNVTYDIASTVYDSVSFSVSAAGATSSPSSLSFKPDGTKMYTVSQPGAIVYQFTLSTAWDVSTTTYDAISFSVGTQDSSVQTITFSPDGTKMYMLGFTNRRVYQYTLSTAWDVSSATYASIAFFVTTQTTAPRSLTFKPDGTKMYVGSSVAPASVFQYTLSTAWDVSTATYDSVSFNVSSQGTAFFGLIFKPDGTKMYMLDNNSDAVYQYTLSTAWGLSTANYDSVSFSVAARETTPRGLQFKTDGTKMYVLGQTADTVFQYSVGSIVSATTTYPANFKFPSGTIPAAPLDGDTDLLDFQSFDGGVTWYGNQLGSDYL